VKYEGRRPESRNSDSADAAPLRRPFIARRLVIGTAFTLAVALILLAGNAMHRQIQALRSSTEWVKHTRDVELALSQLIATVTEAESAVRGYIVTGKSDYLPAFYAAKAEIPRKIALVQRLTADNKSEQEKLQSLQSIIERKLGVLQQGIDAHDHGADAFNSLVANSRGKVVMDQIRQEIDEMTLTEERLLATREAQSEQDAVRTLRLAQITAGTGMLIICCAFAWVSGAMHMRGVAEQKAKRAAADLELRRRELAQALLERDLAEETRGKRELLLQRGQSMAAVGRLAAGLAHALNNDLSVVIGHAELMALDVSRSKQDQESLDAILQSSDAAAKLTNDFRSFGQQQHLTVETVDLNAVLRDLKQLVAPTLPGGIAIELSPTPAPPLASVDRRQLLTALSAAIDNAAKAMPTGGILKLSAARHRIPSDPPDEHPVAAGEYGKLVVADTGSGMTDEVRQHAFEPFFTTKDLSEGAGLGLSMVYGFVQQSGGAVSLRSQPGMGTELTILLPLVAPSGAIQTPVA
jgi:signal transduction histidine kinase